MNKGWWRGLFASVRVACGGMGFWAGWGGFAIAWLAACFPDLISAIRAHGLLEAGFYRDMMDKALQSDTMMFTVPILCALPYTACMVDDIRTGFIKQFLHRTTRTRYILFKLIACGFSGGLVLMLGVLSCYGVAALLFCPLEGIDSVASNFSFALKQAGLYFLSGALWAQVGLVMSTFTESKYMAYAFPFILYYTLIMLHERYVPAFFVLSPKEWLVPRQSWVMGMGGVAILVIEMIIILSLCFCMVAQRRIRRL